MSNFSLTILGSSGALPVYGRFTSAQHLAIRHHQFLVDCGEGCQHQLRRYDLSAQKVNHIFISHLHGDHYLGLAGLLFSMHLQRRESDLHVYSFRGLEEILLAQLKHARSSLNFKVILHPLSEDGTEMIFEDDFLTVHSFPLDHKIPTCGFLFREKPRSRSMDKSKLTGANLSVDHIQRLRRGEDIVNDQHEITHRSDDYTLPPRASRAYAYCSDTQPSDTVLPVIEGVDLLYHEATFAEEEKSKARETRHSTAAEAATVAKAVHARRLVIGHFSARYKDLQGVLNEARAIFAETYLAQEGEIFEITD